MTQTPTKYRAFYWHHALINGVLVYGVTVPAAQVWQATDAMGRPDKGIAEDGAEHWIMRAFCDEQTGRYTEFCGGSASPFTMAVRPVPVVPAAAAPALAMEA